MNLKPLQRPDSASRALIQPQFSTAAAVPCRTDLQIVTASCCCSFELNCCNRQFLLQDPFYLNAAQILQLHHWHPAANNLQPIQGNLVFNYPTQGAAPPSFAPIFSGPLVHLDPAPMARAPMHPAQMEAAPHRFCMEPAPLEPMPLEPAPLELAPLEPAPLEPAPLEPTPLKPAPLEPASVEPEVGCLIETAEVLTSGCHDESASAASCGHDCYLALHLLSQ